MKKPEILAPASTLQSVIAAVNAGCDAIYIGGKSFGARAYAQNPTNSELADIISECHLRGVKVFVTMNTLYKEDELPNVIDFAAEIFKMGADGTIIQDLGLFSILRDNFEQSNIILSASTQLTLHSKDSVMLMASLGFKRIVLARELNKDEITDICSDKGDTEIEGFIHGALCVCYSGRCLMSSMIGGRSGNRGRCAQPCRMEYTLYKNNRKLTFGYLLSPKDIATLDILDEVVGTGLDSLKIEGRMKSPEYVYEVVSTYRKYIDRLYSGDEFKVEPQDKKELTQIFNRGGSSSAGYYNNFAGLDMISESQKSSGVEIGEVISYSHKSKKCRILLSDSVIPGDGLEIWSEPHCGGGVNKKANSGDELWLSIDGNIHKGDRVFKSFDKTLSDKLKKTYQAFTKQLEVKVEIKINKSTESSVYFPDYDIKIIGEPAQQAQNSPMQADDIINRLCKTGGTEFHFNVIKADIEDNIYIPVSQLNSLRRNACEALKEHIIKAGKRTQQPINYISQKPIKAAQPKLSVRVKTAEQFRAALKSGVDRIYSELIDTRLISKAHEKNIELYFALPFIARNGYGSYFEDLDKTDCDGYLLRCYTSYKTAKPVVLDYSFNIMNRASAAELDRIYSPINMTLSTELNASELKKTADEKSEILVYGRLPLMTTHQCPVGLYDGNKKSGKYCSQKDSTDSYYLTDRTNTRFPVIRNCNGCYAQILNSSPIAVTNRIAEILNIKAGFYTLEMTIEDYSETSAIVNAYIEAIKYGKASPTDFFKGKATGGHLFRGVQ